MYGSIAVLLRDILGFIWDLSDVFTVHICLAKAQILIYFPFWSDDFENRFYLNYSITTTKYVTQNSAVNLLVV